MKVVNALPNDKACGPSGIYNEYIKHLDDSTQRLLLKLIQMIFTVGDIPTDWKSAFIYPIPKPTEWHYDISKTRPITLLETIRKAYVKILTNRLSKILQKHNVLRGNNFAGLPGKSTDEPIKMINMLMEDAIEHNKELWILFQDLSKAYNRINLQILTKALERIKLPSHLITMIINLFTDRRNSVFTVFENTPQYDIKIEINQRKVISFLL